MLAAAPLLLLLSCVKDSQPVGATCCLMLVPCVQLEAPALGAVLRETLQTLFYILQAVHLLLTCIMQVGM